MRDIAIDDRFWNITPENFEGLLESEVQDFMKEVLIRVDNVKLSMDSFRNSGKYTWLKDYIIPNLIREKMNIGYTISSDIETFSYTNNMLSGNLRGSPNSWEF